MDNPEILGWTARWMNRAIELSLLCPLAETFSVGAVLVDKWNNEIASGYSRETTSKSHAEESLIEKLDSDCDLSSSTMYVSMEPCSERLSGARPCSEHIINLGIKRVVYALAEPPVFVNCQGDQLLRRAGIEVICLPQFAAEVKAINQHLLNL